MRTLLLAILALTMASAHADVVIAHDPPPDPPPVIIVAPPPAVVVARPHVRPLLGERWTLTPQTGVAWLQVHGTVGNGMLLQPTLTRTFDRLEMSADYTALDWNDESKMRPSGTLHRLGASAQYQLGRVRVERKMTLDLVGAAGLGLQHFVQDHGGSIDRPDLALGVVLRMLTDVDDRESHRIFFGMELGVRLLVTPRANGDTDLGCVVAFGVPIGW